MYDLIVRTVINLSEINEEYVFEIIRSKINTSNAELSARLDSIMENYGDNITKTTGLVLLAQELGILIDETPEIIPSVVIDTLSVNMKNINISGIIVDYVYPNKIHLFTNKDGTSGSVVVLILEDISGYFRIK